MLFVPDKVTWKKSVSSHLICSQWEGFKLTLPKHQSNTDQILSNWNAEMLSHFHDNTSLTCLHICFLYFLTGGLVPLYSLKQCGLFHPAKSKKGVALYWDQMAHRRQEKVRMYRLEIPLVSQANCLTYKKKTSRWSNVYNITNRQHCNS